MKTILSIDGGGIRGIIPATVLAEIERRTGKGCAELFDFVAGTSTGGILAIGLACGYKASELLELYAGRGKDIFRRSLWHRVESLGELSGPKYDGCGASEVFSEYFKIKYLSSAPFDLLVTAYDIERRKAHFFKSWEAKVSPKSDFLMSGVARATSAAPTYFPPAWVTCAAGSEEYALIDGGVFANNPAMCAIADVTRRQPMHAPPPLMVSLGTGNADRPIPYASARCWGLAAWAVPLVDVLIDGVSNSVDYQAREMLPGTYHRLQTVVPHSLQEMDDASPHVVAGLKAVAAELVVRASDEIDVICAEILRKNSQGKEGT